MNVQPITSDTLTSSVLAVPPLARDEQGLIVETENRKIVHHLESGGVKTLLYGGNAILHHVALSEYAELLSMLSSIAPDESVVIPSVGPTYGLMMDQAAILREFDFPTAMILPTRDVCTSQGLARAVNRFVDAVDRPAVLYIKHDGFVDVETVKKLVNDGVLSWIKYAIVREQTGTDTFLRSLIDEVGPERIVSGIGEQPAIVHMRDFGLSSFTSGCVCVAPNLSMDLLRSIQSGEWHDAETVRAIFAPLEDLRNEINPIRVLHTAIIEAGIADAGPLIPLLSEVTNEQRLGIRAAARELFAAAGNLASHD